MTGCYAQRAPEEIARLEGVAWVVGNSHKHLVSAILSPNFADESGDRAVGRSGGQKDYAFGTPSSPSAPAQLVQIQASNDVEVCRAANDSGPRFVHPMLPSAPDLGLRTTLKFWWARSRKNSILRPFLPTIARAPR